MRPSDILNPAKTNVISFEIINLLTTASSNVRSFGCQTEDPRDFSEEKIIASIVPDEDASIRSLDAVGHPPIDMTGDSPAIIIASRPHSHETVEKTRSVESANPRNKINIQEVKHVFMINLSIKGHSLIGI